MGEQRINVGLPSDADSAITVRGSWLGAPRPWSTISLRVFGGASMTEISLSLETTEQLSTILHLPAPRMGMMLNLCSRVSSIGSNTFALTVFSWRAKNVVFS